MKVIVNSSIKCYNSSTLHTGEIYSVELWFIGFADIAWHDGPRIHLYNEQTSNPLLRPEAFKECILNGSLRIIE